MLLPGAEFLGAEELAPGRALADAGAICVLATDCNPGTSPVLSLPLIIGLAVRRYGWTRARGARRLHAQRRLGARVRRPRLDRGRQARRPRPARLAGRAHPLPLRPQPGHRGDGRRRRDHRRRARGAARGSRADRARRERRHDAAGVDRRGRAGGGMVRAPRGGDRAAARARPRRQPVGLPRRARDRGGRSARTSTPCARAGASTARSGSPPASRSPSALPVAVISFADEEGARFNTPTFGSRALVGRLDVDDALARLDDHGVTLGDAMAGAGVDPAGLASAPEWLERLAGFLELHIDQTRDVAAARRPAGVVTRLAARLRLQVELAGRADHAGTTPREERHDALAAAARVIVRADAEAAQRLGMVFTAARLEVEPNAPTTVPSLARLWLDARAPEAEAVESWREAVTARDRAGRRRGGRRAERADRRVVAGHRVRLRGGRGARPRPPPRRSAARLLRRARRGRDRRRTGRPGWCWCATRPGSATRPRRRCRSRTPRWRRTGCSRRRRSSSR